MGYGPLRLSRCEVTEDSSSPHQTLVEGRVADGRLGQPIIGDIICSCWVVEGSVLFPGRLIRAAHTSIQLTHSMPIRRYGFATGAVERF